MTNPQIGNTGVNLGMFRNFVRVVQVLSCTYLVVVVTFVIDDEESEQCFLAGLVIRSLSIRLVFILISTNGPFCLLFILHF